jgi:prepilin-type N-terminal cleavage/methylation domain-containing protein
MVGTEDAFYWASARDIPFDPQLGSISPLGRKGEKRDASGRRIQITIRGADIMKTRNTIGNGQGGFTLIEVIAVLVIVGMLAAVAIPKYMDMQTQAAKQAVQGALAAGASNVTMVYSKLLLEGNYTIGNLYCERNHGY